MWHRVLLFAAMVFFFCIGNAGSIPKHKKFPGVFLKAGEVWLKVKEPIQLTDTKGQIDKISTSPAGRYVAANRLVGQFDASQMEDDPGGGSGEDSDKTKKTAKMVAEYSVLIIDLLNRKVIKELKEPEGMVFPGYWFAEARYSFRRGSVLDSLEFIYDATMDSEQRPE